MIFCYIITLWNIQKFNGTQFVKLIAEIKWMGCLIFLGHKFSAHLDSAFSAESCVAFFFFFFFFFLFSFTRFKEETKFTIHETNVTVLILFIYYSWDPHLLYSEKNIKNESHDTIYTFKNYFVTVFSVIHFQSNGPLI